jgi:hypothetical protein
MRKGGRDGGRVCAWKDWERESDGLRHGRTEEGKGAREGSEPGRKERQREGEGGIPGLL